MRVFRCGGEHFEALPAVPAELPLQGFLWIGCARDEFEPALPGLQAALQRWGCGTLVDEHVADLLNAQLPSRFDYTSWYDLMVFRRLAAGPAGPAVPAAAAMPGLPATPTGRGPAAPQRRSQDAIDTRPVGFAVFDRVLLTVHPADCAVREFFVQRLATLSGQAEGRGSARMPSSPADLMLRMVNHIVDSYLDLRRLLTRELGALQQQLLDPKSRYADWQSLLDARAALHLLEDTCEDQRSALQEWIDALDEWPDAAGPQAQRERELLRVRSRDVQEHIERVLGHVRRVESSAEAAVQMHFSALGHRTNDIMRTLTVLTAVFLPLNLITGFFGMNFEALPLIHSARGFWLSFALMLAVGAGLGLYFWRKRYLGSSRG
ncbi:MAG: magnesium transporter CorA family protein [Burkholderiales bacterium]|nr:magnesium transporter CorA family protein [Burkholderiales bacterium]